MQTKAQLSEKTRIFDIVILKILNFRAAFNSFPVIAAQRGNGQIMDAMVAVNASGDFSAPFLYFSREAGISNQCPG